MAGICTRCNRRDITSFTCPACGHRGVVEVGSIEYFQTMRNTLHPYESVTDEHILNIKAVTETIEELEDELDDLEMEDIDNEQY